ncbi:MAG: hypothetical protein ACLP05_00145 [Candidatus Kryptoniota bacterium]
MTEAVNKRNHLASFLLGILLLIFGVLLLMGRAGVIDLNFNRVVAFLILVVGGFEAITAFGFSNRRRLFFGSALFLMGMLVALISYNFIPDAWDQIWPSVLLIPGLAFLMLYFSHPKEYYLLIVAVLFVAVGFAGLLFVKGNFNFGGSIIDMFRFLVPAAIVVAGCYVIWKKLFKSGY